MQDVHFLGVQAICSSNLFSHSAFVFLQRCGGSVIISNWLASARVACEKGGVMTKKKQKVHFDSGQSASQLLGGASTGELQQLASLLQLLRSGSPLVQSVLSAGQDTQAQHSAVPRKSSLAKGSQSAQIKVQVQEQAVEPTMKKSKEALTAGPGWQVQRRQGKKQEKLNNEPAVEVPEVLSPSNAIAVEDAWKLTRD